MAIRCLDCGIEIDATAEEEQEGICPICGGTNIEIV